MSEENQGMAPDQSVLAAKVAEAFERQRAESADAEADAFEHAADETADDFVTGDCPEFARGFSHTGATAGQAWNVNNPRWWQCPICKVYVDAMVDVGGRSQIALPDTIRCPACGCMELDTVEGHHFEPGIPKLTADVRKPSVPGLAEVLREARAAIEQAALFPTDEFDDKADEPKWPRELGAAIVGAAMHLAREAAESKAQLERRLESLERVLEHRLKTKFIIVGVVRGKGGTVPYEKENITFGGMTAIPVSSISTIERAVYGLGACVTLALGTGFSTIYTVESPLELYSKIEQA